MAGVSSGLGPSSKVRATRGWRAARQMFEQNMRLRGLSKPVKLATWDPAHRTPAVPAVTPVPANAATRSSCEERTIEALRNVREFFSL